MTEYASLVVKVDSTAAKKAEGDLNALSRAGGNADRSMADVAKSSVAAAAAIAGVGISTSAAVRGALDYADAWEGSANQLRQVTESAQQLSDVQAQLIGVANETRSGFESTANLYSRLARSATDLGLSQGDLISLTRTINQTFASSGATTAEMASAITQLSQGLASGTLRGDEFNSVAESAPGLMRAIARETNLTIGELREFAATGGITADIVVNAVRNAAGQIEGEFSRSVATLGQQFEVANNNMMEFVGNSTVVRGGVGTLGRVVVQLSESMDRVAGAATLAGIAIAGKLAGPAVAGMLAATKASIAYSMALANGTVVTLNSAKADAMRAAESARVAAADVVRAKSTAAVTAAEVAAYQAVLRSTQAEIALEVARHKAQINDVGRQMSVQRLAALRMELAAATTALQRVEAAHTASVTAVAAAENVATVATTRLTAANAAATVGFGLMAGAARVATAAMAFLGGPVGVVMIAVGALFAFREELGLVKPAAQTAAEGVDHLGKSVDGLTEAQAKLRIMELGPDYEKAKRNLEGLTILAADARKKAESLSFGSKVLGVTDPITERFESAAVRAEAARDEALQKVTQYQSLVAQLESVTNKPKTEKPTGPAGASVAAFPGAIVTQDFGAVLAQQAAENQQRLAVEQSYLDLKAKMYAESDEGERELRRIKTEIADEEHAANMERLQKEVDARRNATDAMGRILDAGASKSRTVAKAAARFHAVMAAQQIARDTPVAASGARAALSMIPLVGPALGEAAFWAIMASGTGLAASVLTGSTGGGGGGASIPATSGGGTSSLSSPSGVPMQQGRGLSVQVDVSGITGDDVLTGNAMVKIVQHIFDKFGETLKDGGDIGGVKVVFNR